MNLICLRKLIKPVNLEYRILYNKLQIVNIWKILFNPQAPVAQQITDQVVFRRFQGEGVEFFLF